MKKILFVLLLLLPFISACNNKSSFYRDIEKINENFSFKLFIYGEEITEEKHAEALPDNLNYEYIESLDDQLDFDGIFVLMITKDVNDEEMVKLNTMFMDNVNSLFYDITNYRDKLKSSEYDFIKYSSIQDNDMSLFYFKSKGPYIGSTSEPTIWGAFSLIDRLLRMSI